MQNKSFSIYEFIGECGKWKTQTDIYQWCPKLILKGRYPACFESFPDSTHVKQVMVQKQGWINLRQAGGEPGLELGTHGLDEWISLKLNWPLHPRFLNRVTAWNEGMCAGPKCGPWISFLWPWMQFRNGLNGTTADRVLCFSLYETFSDKFIPLTENLR